MKKRIIICLLSALFVVSLCSNIFQILNSAFLTLKWESMMQWTQEDKDRISVNDMPIPYYIPYRRILGLPFRSRAAIGADFTALLLQSDGFYPDKEKDASSDRVVRIDFADQVPKEIVVYDYAINSYGMDQTPFFMRDGGAVKTKYTPESGSKSFQFMLNWFPTSGVVNRLVIVDYRGVRVLCKFDGYTTEYVFAVRTGVPLDIDYDSLEAEVFEFEEELS